MRKVNIGSLIKEIIDQKKTELDLNYEQIADRLGRTRVSLYRIIKTGYIDVNTLFNLSVILKYNFFKHFLDAEDIKELLLTNKSELKIIEQEDVKMLKKENGYIKLENEYLKKIVKLHEENP